MRPALWLPLPLTKEMLPLRQQYCLFHRPAWSGLCHFTGDCMGASVTALWIVLHPTGSLFCALHLELPPLLHWVSVAATSLWLVKFCPQDMRVECTPHVLCATTGLGEYVLMLVCRDGVGAGSGAGCQQHLGDFDSQPILPHALQSGTAPQGVCLCNMFQQDNLSLVPPVQHT